MPNRMTFEEYKKLTPEEREIHDFEMMQGIYTTMIETCEHTKLTNGRVGKLEIWRGIIVGGLIVASAIIVPIFLDLIKSHK